MALGFLPVDDVEIIFNELCDQLSRNEENKNDHEHTDALNKFTAYMRTTWIGNALEIDEEHEHMEPLYAINLRNVHDRDDGCRTHTINPVEGFHSDLNKRMGLPKHA